MNIHERLSQRRDNAFSQGYQSNSSWSIPTKKNHHKKLPLENLPGPKWLTIFVLMLLEVGVIYMFMQQTPFAEVETGAKLLLMR